MSFGFASPQIDRYLRQWRLYKRLFLIFAVLNAFSLSASVVLGVRYFAFKKSSLAEQNHLLDQTAEADRALDLLASLRRDTVGSKHLVLHTREDEMHVLSLLDRWQNFRSIAGSLNVVLPESMRLLGEDTNTGAEFESLASKLSDVKAHSYQQMRDNLHAFAGVQKELVMAGLLTLLFGFLLPSFVMWLLSRAIRELRREMHEPIIDFLRNWRQAQTDHGPGAFKNPEFWLQILLIVGQFSGQMSTHPAAQVASEIAYMIRVELQRAAASQAPPSPGAA